MTPASDTILPGRATLCSALDHLEAAIDAENAAFETRQPLDIAEINRRKSRCLLELSRAARGMPGAGDAALEVRVAGLRQKLERNCRILSVQLAAAREVGAILDGVLREADSDGTYSAVAGHRGGGR